MKLPTQFHRSEWFYSRSCSFQARLKYKILLSAFSPLNTSSRPRRRKKSQLFVRWDVEQFSFFLPRTDRKRDVYPGPGAQCATDYVNEANWSEKESVKYFISNLAPPANSFLFFLPHIFLLELQCRQAEAQNQQLTQSSGKKFDIELLKCHKEPGRKKGKGEIAGENKRDCEKAEEISQLFGTLSDEYRGHTTRGSQFSRLRFDEEPRYRARESARVLGLAISKTAIQIFFPFLPGQNRMFARTLATDIMPPFPVGHLSQHIQLRSRKIERSLFFTNTAVKGRFRFTFYSLDPSGLERTKIVENLEICNETARKRT